MVSSQDPSSRFLPLKQIQCSILLNVRRFAPIPAPSPHRKQLLPWLTLCQQAEHQEGWEGSIPPSSLQILHRCGCSTGMGAPQLGDPAPPRTWWGSPHSTSHPWKAMYKANSRIMSTIRGCIRVISQKHSTSNLFLMFVVHGGGGCKVHRHTGTFTVDQPTDVPVSMSLFMLQDRCPGQVPPSYPHEQSAQNRPFCV